MGAVTRPHKNEDQELIGLKTSNRTTTSTAATEGVKLRANGSLRATRFLIPNYPFQYLRAESPYRGTTPAGTEGEAPGTAAASFSGAT